MNPEVIAEAEVSRDGLPGRRAIEPRHGTGDGKLALGRRARHPCWTTLEPTDRERGLGGGNEHGGEFGTIGGGARPYPAGEVPFSVWSARGPGHRALEIRP